MKFRVFLLMLLVGCIILFGFVFLVIKIQQQEVDRKQFIKERFSGSDSPPPQIPRTEEIPDEIRQKFAALTDIPEKPELIAEFVQGDTTKTVEFSPTNPNLVISRTYNENYEDNIRLWDVKNPETPLSVFSGESVSFSPDGKMLAILNRRSAIINKRSIDDRIKLWDIAKEQFISSIPAYGFSVAFSPANNLLALETSGLELWNVSDSTQPVEAIKLEGKNFEKEHTFSADGKLMATIESRTDTVNIWKINGNQATKLNSINVIDRKVGWIEAIQFLPNPNNPILAIADNKEYLRLYYPPHWQNYNTIPAGNVNALAFTPDGKTIVCGNINELQIWSVENGDLIASIDGYSKWVNCVDVSADGNLVAVGGNDGVFRVWDIKDYLQIKRRSIHNIVVPIYFLPTNLQPQEDIPEKIDKILKDVQTFYADEMERHGFGRKTFNFEKNSNGSAKVLLFEGKTSDDYYGESSSRVIKEIKQRFDSPNNSYFIIVEKTKYIETNVKKSRENGSKEKKYTSSGLEYLRTHLRDMMLSMRGHIYRKQVRNIVVHTPLNGYAKHVLAAKFGYAFGLHLDYRSPSYLMSESRQSKHLSKSSAERLNISKFFNTEQTYFDNKTNIKKLSHVRGKVRFELEDTDGLSQVRLLAKSKNDNPPLGFQKRIDPTENQAEWRKFYKGNRFTLHDVLTLDGKKKVKVKLDYPKVSDEFIELHVIDSHGNHVCLIEKIDSSLAFFLHHILN